MTKFRHLLLKLCIAIAAWMQHQYAWTEHASTPQLMSASTIQSLALEWARSHLADVIAGRASLSRIEFMPGKMDSRLNLPNCDRALEFEPQQNTARSNRLLIKTRCNGQQPWALFIPIDVRRWQRAAVAKTLLVRGVPISASDIELREIELNNGANHFFTALNQVQGSVAKRDIGTGRPLTSSNTKPATLVHRGDQVTIIAKAGGVQVKMNGVAMADGLKNQQIQVKNLSSKRLIKARVIEVGKVAALM